MQTKRGHWLSGKVSGRAGRQLPVIVHPDSSNQWLQCFIEYLQVIRVYEVGLQRALVGKCDIQRYVKAAVFPI